MPLIDNDASLPRDPCLLPSSYFTYVPYHRTIYTSSFSQTRPYPSDGHFITVASSSQSNSRACCAIHNHVGGRPRNQEQSNYAHYSHSCFPMLLSPLIVFLAPRTPKAPRERPLLRLPRSVAAMGLAQIRYLHLPRMRRPASGTRRAHFIRAQYHDGRIQGGGDGAHGFGRE